MQFDIFGTCVTRDAFSFHNNNHSVYKYSSRSSLVSAIQQPLNLNDSEVNLESSFHERVLREDLNKNFKRYARNPKSKIVIVDLIQERHPLNVIEGVGITTYSDQYGKSKLPVGRLYKNDQKLRIFDKNITKIVKLFENYDMVILHEVEIGDKYITKQGNVKDLKIKDVDEYFIKKGQEYHKLFKEYIPNLRTIKIDGFLVDDNNKWGAGPSHFEDGYYLKFNEALDYVIENNRDFHYKKE